MKKPVLIHLPNTYRTPNGLTNICNFATSYTRNLVVDKRSVSIICISFLTIIFAGFLILSAASFGRAQENPTPNNQVTSSNGSNAADKAASTGGAGFISLIGQKLGFGDRSKTFAEMRRSRNQILSNIDRLKLEKAELQAQLAKLPETFDLDNPVSQPLRTASQFDNQLLDLDESIRRAKFQTTEILSEMEAEKIRLEEELSLLTSRQDEKQTQTGIADTQLVERISDLKIRLASFDKEAERSLDRAKFEVEDLEARKAGIEDIIKRESSRIQQESADRQKRLNETEKDRKQLASQIVQKEKDIRQEEENLETLNAEINDFIDVSDADSSFKLNISMMFAFLVFIVIVGFFLIIRSKDDVVFEIFSKESGIQFITLFSIVISIILFGITGVLEGKELAALLAGLSGYILGRGSGLNQNLSSGGGSHSGPLSPNVPPKPDEPAENVKM